MSAVAVAVDRRNPFTSRAGLADNAGVTGRTHAESAARAAGAAGRRRLVPVEVVAAARDGDRHALGRVCTVIHGHLYGFYRYAGLGTQEAEDLAADVIEDVIARVATLRKPESFDAWMWSIGRNRLKGWLRANRRPARFEPVTPAQPGPEERAVDAEDHSSIRVALSMLSVRDRELLWLREVEGLSYDEIGGRFSAATGTIRVACHRARKKLEQAYRQAFDPMRYTVIPVEK